MTRINGSVALMKMTQEEAQLLPLEVDLVAMEKASLSAVQTAASLVIQNDKDMAQIVDLTRSIKNFGKQLDEIHRSCTAPLKLIVKRIDLMFKPIEDRYAEAERMTKFKMTNYQEQKEREQAAERARVEAEYQKQLKAAEKKAEKKGVDPVYVPPPIEAAPPPKTMFGATGSATLRVDWTFEIVDAKKVPPPYTMPDERAIGQAVKSGVRTIPGVRIFERKTMSVR